MKTTYCTIPETHGRSFNAARYLKTHQVKPDNHFFSKEFPFKSNPLARPGREINSFIRSAMAGTYPNTSISYPASLISHGQLPYAENACVSATGDGDIIFTWPDNSGFQTANKNDRVILIAYFPAIKETIYTLHAATRGSCYALLSIHKMKSYSVETWIGFVSNDERSAADSVYVGRVVL